MIKSAKRFCIGTMLALPATLAFALPATLALAAPSDPPASGLPESVQRHIDLAYLLANGDISQRNLPGMLYLVNDKVFAPPVPAAHKMATLPAAKAFDQFYYLGINWVSAWALNTRDGIVLFDTLPTPGEAAEHIEGGLRKVGLDPKNIKYIVITHAHADHFGGAKYLADKYHARVLMSDIDWSAVENPATPWAATVPPRPTRDMTVADGQKLTVGGTTLSFYLTPGHTPGTLSMLIPVTDKGRSHTISFIGGTGLNRVSDPSKGGARVLEHSLMRFARVSLAAGADAVVSSHPFLDDAWEKAKLVNDGKAGKVSPWVATPEAVMRYYASTIEAVRAVEAADALKPTS